MFSLNVYPWCLDLLFGSTDLRTQRRAKADGKYFSKKHISLVRLVSSRTHGASFSSTSFCNCSLWPYYVFLCLVCLWARGGAGGLSCTSVQSPQCHILHGIINLFSSFSSLLLCFFPEGHPAVTQNSPRGKPETASCFQGTHDFIYNAREIIQLY